MQTCLLPLQRYMLQETGQRTTGALHESDEQRQDVGAGGVKQLKPHDQHAGGGGLQMFHQAFGVVGRRGEMRGVFQNAQQTTFDGGERGGAV